MGIIDSNAGKAVVARSFFPPHTESLGQILATGMAPKSFLPGPSVYLSGSSAETEPELLEDVDFPSWLKRGRESLLVGSFPLDAKDLRDWSMAIADHHREHCNGDDLWLSFSSRAGLELILNLRLLRQATPSLANMVSKVGPYYRWSGDLLRSNAPLGLYTARVHFLTMDKTQADESNILGAKFVPYRARKFRMRTTIEETSSGKLATRKTFLSGRRLGEREVGVNGLKLRECHSVPWFEDASLLHELFLSPTDSISSLKSLLVRVRQYLETVLELPDPSQLGTNAGHLPGWLIDAVPSNIVIAKQGQPVFLDREFSLETTFPIELLAFRGLMEISAVNGLGLLVENGTTRGNLIRKLIAKLFPDLSSSFFHELVEWETSFQARVRGLRGWEIGLNQPLN